MRHCDYGAMVRCWVSAGAVHFHLHAIVSHLDCVASVADNPVRLVSTTVMGALQMFCSGIWSISIHGSGSYVMVLVLFYKTVNDNNDKVSLLCVRLMKQNNDLCHNNHNLLAVGLFLPATFLY